MLCVFKTFLKGIFLWNIDPLHGHSVHNLQTKIKKNPEIQNYQILLLYILSAINYVKLGQIKKLSKGLCCLLECHNYGFTVFYRGLTGGFMWKYNLGGWMILVEHQIRSQETFLKVARDLCDFGQNLTASFFFIWLKIKKRKTGKIKLFFSCLGSSLWPPHQICKSLEFSAFSRWAVSQK